MVVQRVNGREFLMRWRGGGGATDGVTYYGHGYQQIVEAELA
jgi:hypothetical protein